MTIPRIGAAAEPVTDERHVPGRVAGRTFDRLLGHLAPGRLMGRLARYGAVSVITTGLSLSILCVLLVCTSIPASMANLLASAAGIGPSYALNRRWVWRRAGRASWRRETGPFWAMSVAGLLLSTVATGVVAAGASGLSTVLHTAVVVGASLGAYGSLWLAEFVILERFVFANRSASDAGATQAPTASGSLPNMAPSEGRHMDLRLQ